MSCSRSWLLRSQMISSSWMSSGTPVVSISSFSWLFILISEKQEMSEVTKLPKGANVCPTQWSLLQSLWSSTSGRSSSSWSLLRLLRIDRSVQSALACHEFHKVLSLILAICPGLCIYIRVSMEQAVKMQISGDGIKSIGPSCEK